MPIHSKGNLRLEPSNRHLSRSGDRIHFFSFAAETQS